MPIIDYKNVDIHIDSKIILENVTFNLNAGEFAYLLGTVGSGKSSLMKTLYGEVPVHSGDALLFDKFDMRRVRRSKLSQLRKQIGIVFQDFQLLTDRNVYDNLDFVLRCTGWKKKKEREARIMEVLELVELAPKGYKMPHELSGGEQQRVVIARAILNRPKLLLADEPTGNLDNETGHKIMKLLHRISQEDGTAVLMITHNEQWLSSYPAYEYRCANGCLKVEKGNAVPAAVVVESAPLNEENAAPAAGVVESAPLNEMNVAPAAVMVESAPLNKENVAPAAVVVESTPLNKENVAPAAVVVESTPLNKENVAPAAVVVESIPLNEENVAPAPVAVELTETSVIVEKTLAEVKSEAVENDIQTVDC